MENKYGEYRSPSRGETFVFEVYHRIENSKYDYEEQPYLTFKGRIASPTEKKKYQLQRGVNATENSLYIFASNLPTSELKPSDRVKFKGTMKLIESIGYYLNDLNMINGDIMSYEYLMSRSAKGITLQ